MNTTVLNNSDSLTKYLWSVCSPILVLFGTIGNILSFIVLNQRDRKRTSTTTYLSALALCDLFVLHIGLVRQWIRVVFDFDFRTINESVCKIHFYLVNFLLQLSSWILVAITVERVKSVQKPHMAKVGCTRKVAIFVLLAEVTVLVVLNGHILYGVKIRIVNDNETNSSVYTCEPDNANDTYLRFMYFVWTWIDCIIVFLFPFLILMTGNILIIVNVKRSKRFLRRLLNNVTGKNRNTLQKSLIPMTSMLLTLNSVFFVCVGPINIYSIVQFYWRPTDTDLFVLKLRLWVIGNILMYTNNAVNFLLYVMCGSKFRMAVKNLLLICCKG